MKFLSRKDILLLKRTLSYTISYRVKLFFTLVTVLMRIVFDIVQPLMWGKMIATLFEKDYNSVLISILIIFVLNISQSSIELIKSYLFTSLNSNITYNIKHDIYKKILNLPVKAFDEMRTGDFLSRLEGDAISIANIISNHFLIGFVDILKVIAIGITIFSINIPLSVIIICSFPISFIIFIKFGNILRKKNKEAAQLRDNYYSNIQQSIQGIREIKSLGIKDYSYKLFSTTSNKLKDSTINLNFTSVLSSTLARAMNYLSEAAVMAFGIFLISKGSLSIEYFIAFSSYSHNFSLALMNITKLNSSIQSTMTSLERSFEIIDDMLYSSEKFGCREVKEINGNIKLENVCFKYRDNKKVLNMINFEIKPNKKIAIVGSNGSGKTTIFNLLLRLYDYDSGRILIDDIDIQDFNEQSLRNHISVVLQEPFLFNMSIKDNLSIANLKANEEELINACRSVYIHDFIMSLPEGYDTIIGENGVTLSGGQKQRLAIARALVKKSKIILLDEATSSLDNESQLYLKKTIDEISKKHTVIIIAHKFSSINNVDEIIVIDEGEVVGQDSHKKLISNSKVYRHLYENEFKEFKNVKEVI
ncbi:ABC transporter ATP-binding protein [Maledivibacter halophilus]|uniref:ATP-binding cassette, subfamily B n=1 Tax=Maledivibacter halophilus TaxID=36842 RepID=A0A1T5MHI9_9FIRM|nr:ABC transporter ATP-binding protein [Maledivibacter halophilus]SKC87697.1 ATP-binding cassette, subfamily B [Maledivibacter halophilus]